MVDKNESVVIREEISISLDNKQHIKQVRNLWEIVFSEDSSMYLDFYFQHVYPNNVVVLAKIGETVVGMLHMNPYELVGTTTYYIVGVATHPDYRGQGIMRKMMEFSIEYAKLGKINDLILLPVDERFYTSFGFKFVSQQYNTHIQASLYQKSISKSGYIISEQTPSVEHLLNIDIFIQRMQHLKEREGGILSYKPFEPLWTEKYLRQLYYEMLSEDGKITSVDGHIVLYYEDEIIEVRVVFVDSKSSLTSLVNWLVLIADQRQIVFHEVNERIITHQFTYHQQNTYDIRPYMMVLSDLCSDNSYSTLMCSTLLQKDNYFNEVV